MLVIRDYSIYDHMRGAQSMEKKLLILGLLLSHDMHGYQLNDMLQQNPSTAIALKKSNTYRLLNKIEEDGWVTSFEEQEGNRPQRQVYTVTEAGEAAFYDLLRDNLAAPPSPEFPGVVGLDFLYLLPVEETIPLLNQRLQAVTAQFEELDRLDADIRQTHLAAAYLHAFYAREIQWLDELIQRLQSEHPTES
jgi:DNA-binding PadR family transcriptional regulator